MEIIGVQQSTLRAVLSNFETGEVDVLNVSRPQHVQRKARFSSVPSDGQAILNPLSPTLSRRERE